VAASEPTHETLPSHLSAADVSPKVSILATEAMLRKNASGHLSESALAALLTGVLSETAQLSPQNVRTIPVGSSLVQPAGAREQPGTERCSIQA